MAKAKTRLRLTAVAIVIVGVTIVAVLGLRGAGTETSSSSGLPATADHHSLLVSSADPRTILLGTHDGLYRSTDGGVHWSTYALAGDDAMNLVRPRRGETVWLAGHGVFARSDDGGAGWRSLRPQGLPSLDLHGFAVDPRDGKRLYAAVAGQGLYRSEDGGRRFLRVPTRVGGAVMALAVSENGMVFAADMQRGVLTSSDGRSWREALNAQILGLAVNPADSNNVLAAGPGILQTRDGGKHWRLALRLDAGAGPVTFAPSDPRIAYAVGFDRSFYRSTDAGAHWTRVGVS